jgi:diguanylate cyclase (GGDEF)-like protein
LTSLRGPTVGVLSTAFGGPYFGDLLGGMAVELAAARGRLVAIQTVDAGTVAQDFPEPPAFPHPVAWNHLSGFIVLLNGVSIDFLKTARSKGFPVVVISDRPAGFSCPTILPDNFSGARAATQHLIDHGHTRIAFVGFTGQEDVRERYQAYQDTLRDNGLTPDPELLFNVEDMQEPSGERAGRAMLAAGLPSTAVITGNDRNAVGLMRVLTAAGLDLPTDQAVIGFDDTEAGARLTPSLTSVRQPLEDIGALAVRLLAQMIEGQEVASAVHLVPTSLTVRESCGCAGLLSAAPGADAVEDLTGDAQDLVPGLQALLGEHLGQGFEAGHPTGLAPGAEAIVASLRAAVDGTEGPAGLSLRRRLFPLARVLDDSERVVDVLRLIGNFGRRLQAGAGLDRDVDATRRVEDCLRRIYILLVQAQTSLQAEVGKSMMGSLSTQYSISLELLRSQEQDPRSLDWLRLTGVRGGCLGLWPEPTGSDQHSRLHVVRTFDREVGSSEGPQDDVEVASFPPTSMMAMAEIALDDMVYIAHLKVGSGDWGMLALVGPVQAYVQEGRETMNQWAALLSVALEHEAVLKTMREQEEHLRRAALYDELTGLPNRTLFRSRLTMAMERAARRPSYRYAVLMLDLDGFKLVNDSLGHQAGDRLLQLVAARLSANLRVLDTAARFGGDEFAVLLEETTDETGPSVLAERLQAALSAPHNLAGTEVVVSASIGIAIGNPGYDNTEAIMRDADAAMYHAKTHGKRAHAVFDPSMHVAAVNRLRIEGELRRALANDELALHYQPIVDLKTGTISGAEALIRWQHPTRGVLSPAAFLPVAEESGLILPIGTWVLDEAFGQMVTWKLDQAGSAPFMMSINVSNRQFWQSNLIDDVSERLSSSGLDPSCVAIEITEGVIMHDVKLASSMFSRLKDLGVQIHIDDFGTGYSSLEALHDLSIDALKIDRSFVSRLTISTRSRELVRTIVTMGLNLELDVIAEGIETAEELEMVRELGCTHGQGYFYSRPVLAEAMKAQLDAER